MLDARAPGTPGADELAAVARHVLAGGLLTYPTETVYGFGCRVEPGAIARLRALKGRAEGKPLLVLVPDRAAAAGLDWTDEARELAHVFWPGGLTLVLRDPRGTFPAGVRSPQGTVAVRVSPHPLVRALLDVLGEPLTSTSANVPGAPPAADGAAASAAALALGAGAEMWVLDQGALPPSEPSTLVDCSGDRARVVRLGAVPVGRLRCVLPELPGPRVPIAAADRRDPTDEDDPREGGSR